MRNAFVRLAVMTALAVVSVNAQAPQSGITADARAIVARHVKASGDAGGERVQSVRATGAMLMPAQNITGTIEMFTARPNKFLLKVEIPGVGKLETGFDGERGWSIDPLAGPALMTGKELAQTKFDANFDGNFSNVDANYTALTAAGIETFDERKAHRIEAVNVNGDRTSEFFDVETGLHIGSKQKRDSMMGEMEVTSFLRDYRKVEGRLEPHVVVQRTMGMEQVLRIDKIEVNVVKPDTFAMPPAIKALIK